MLVSVHVNSIEKVEDQVDDREDVENMHFAVFFFLADPVVP